jgi:hypothetical protein
MSFRLPALALILVTPARIASTVGTAPKKAGNAESVSKGVDPLPGVTRADDSNHITSLKLHRASAA